LTASAVPKTLLSTIPRPLSYPSRLYPLEIVSHAEANSMQ
jgi:hypothetical protein